jgi:hypothetical protein
MISTPKESANSISAKAISKRAAILRAGELLKSFLFSRKLSFGEEMFRSLKPVLAFVAVAGLSLFSLSCSSASHSQVRFVHAIQDALTLNVDINGKPYFNNVSFLGVSPNQPNYTSVPSGSDTLQAFYASNSSEAFSTSLDLNSGTNYTLVATGFATGSTGSNVNLLQIPDLVPSPPSGDVEFRVIHASPSGPGTVDVYIELDTLGSGVTQPLAPPITIKGLAYTQASAYYQFSVNPNNEPQIPGFTVYVCASGSTTPIITEQFIPQDTGEARTFVLTDVQNGNAMSPTYLELTDQD